jgi:hypothetical protein
VTRAALPGMRGALQVAALVALLLAAFAARVVSSARAELELGTQAEAAGDRDAAQVHYRRAARWYAPGSPYHVKALSQLARIGAEAEAAGESERALSAYRAVRSSILAARSFYVPERARLDAADLRIAELMAAQPPPPMDAGKSRDQLRAEHLSLLKQDPDPNLFWTLVLLLGFVSWVGGAFVLSVRGIDAEDRWVWREARLWGSVVVAGFGLFVLGLALA